MAERTKHHAEITKKSKTRNKRSSNNTNTPDQSEKNHECYTRGPRELFINGGHVYGGQTTNHTHGISGLMEMKYESSTTSSKNNHDDYDEEFLEKFTNGSNNIGNYTKIAADKILAPYLFKCGERLWCGGDCTGAHIFIMTCVDCAERQQLLPKQELQKIVQMANVDRANAEMLVKSGFARDLSAAYVHLNDIES